MKQLYLLYLDLTSNHILALLLLSLTTSLIIMLLGRLFRTFPQREAHLQRLMQPQIDKIRREHSGAEAHARLRSLHRRYRYHPILALRSAIPLFLQLPFLFAAYHALKALPELQGISFGIISDLSRPDALLVGYNVLPFVMTGINLLTTAINPIFSLRDRVQAVAIAGIFLILLYNAPAALLIYWTLNNLFFLLRTLWQRHKAPKTATSKPGPSRYLPELMQGLFTPFFSLIILSNLLQFLADAEGRYFSRFSKTVPLLVAALGYYLCQLWRLKQSAHRLGLIIGALPLIAIALAQALDWYQIAANNYLIFPLLAGFYLLLGITLRLITIIYRRPQPDLKNPKRNSPRHILNLAALLALLLIPALHLAARNQSYLSGGYYLLFLSLPLILFALARLFLQLFSVNNAEPFPTLNTLYSVAFSFLIMSLPTIRAALQKNSAHDGDFWLILLGTMLIIWYIYSRPSSRILNSQFSILNSEPPILNSNRSQFQPPNSQFSILNFQLDRRSTNSQFSILNYLPFFLFSVFLLRFGLSFRDEQAASRRDLTPIPAVLQELSFTDSANVYLFVYDGVPNERVFRDQDLPFEPLQGILTDYDYKLYPDTYTLGDESLNSMAMTLNITDEHYSSQSRMQDVYSGNSVANLTLRAQGYSTHKLLENYYTGSAAIANSEIVEEHFPPKELSDLRSDFFLTLLRGLLQGEFRFDTKGILAEQRYTETDRQARKHELIRQPATRRFVLDHFSQPGHSQNSGKCLPNETELWIESYLAALKQLEADLATIREYDPGAIVILIGDHGPALTGDCYILQKWAREDITAELIWDRIGTLLAIHWPDPARAGRYDQNLQLNQDIFAIVFAYLADDPEPLELLPDRTFSGYELLTRPAVKFRMGEMVE